MADIKKIIIGGTTYPVKDDSKQVKIDSSNKLSADLVDDTSTTNKFVTSSEKSTWNNKSNFSGNYNDLTNKPTIPTTLSQLTDDSTHRVVTDAEKSSWDGKAKPTPVVNHGTSDTTFALTPNILHVWGEVTALTLTLATPTDSTIVNEYMFQFTSGSTATTLSMPSSVVWDKDKGALTVESGYIYQVSILNNVALWARVAV